MIVKDIMDKNVQKTEPGINAREAARMMTDSSEGYILIVENGKLIGIVTEDDITSKVVAEGRHPHEVKVEDIMAKKVQSIGPGESIEDAASMMTEKKIKKLPVVEDKKLLGIVTAEDMIASEPKMMKHLSELVLFARKPQKMAG